MNFKIGTYYYPEQWPREQWERDFDNIVAMGLQIVHMAEFAWFSLEPKPGEFRFEWLDQALSLASARKLDVILCTPTASPPIWLAHDEPKSLPVDEYGRPGRFGGRRHYSPTSSAMREATKRIVTRMAERYGDHPSVIGWQIDNEYGGDFDQSDETHAMYRAWLKHKYETIDKLNAAWGCQFWNTYYTSFDQILLARNDKPTYGNPHELLDAQRFWSWALADFNKLQADILKPRVGSRFITTNFMPFHRNINPMDTIGSLNLFSWDSYPVTGWEKNIADETYRIADPAPIGFVHDQMASYTNRWALMEIQPGQVNWSGVPVLLYPGTVRLWLWTAYAHGAEFITTYRYRQPRFGTELFHHGLVGTDGVTPSAGGREFAQTISEIKQLAAVEAKTQASAPAPAPAAPTRARSARAIRNPQSAIRNAPTVGLLFDFDQLWEYQALPQARRWNQPHWIKTWYAAIARLGLRVKVIHPEREWHASELSMIVAPGVQMVSDELISKWNDYASNGGNLVLTCRTALMDKTGQLFEGPTAAPIVPMIGAAIEAYDGLPDGHYGSVELDSAKYAWGVWGDLLYAEPTTKVIAKYADQFYAGAVAVTRAKHGKGTVAYCGVFAEQPFIDALMERLATDANLPTTILPQRVHVLERDGHKILLNYQDKPVTAPAGKNARFIVGNATVEPAGVAVWEE